MTVALTVVGLAQPQPPTRKFTPHDPRSPTRVRLTIRRRSCAMDRSTAPEAAMDIDWTGVYLNPQTLALDPNGVDIPTYGNYGGPYHTGGDVAPVDPLDAVFQIHDNTP